MKIFSLLAMIALLSLPVVADDVFSAPTAPTPKHYGENNGSSEAGAIAANGTIKSIAPRKGTVTIEHDAVPALKWPAMTMPFKATPEQLAGLKVGDRVAFEFQADGMSATIVSIKREK